MPVPEHGSHLATKSSFLERGKRGTREHARSTRWLNWNTQIKATDGSSSCVVPVFRINNGVSFSFRNTIQEESEPQVKCASVNVNGFATKKRIRLHRALGCLDYCLHLKFMGDQNQTKRNFFFCKCAMTISESEERATAQICKFTLVYTHI